MRLRKEGKSLREIAEALKRSPSTISRILRAEGPVEQARQNHRRSASSEAGGRSRRQPVSGRWGTKAAPVPSMADVQELHERISRLESSLTALATAVQALIMTRPIERNRRRS